MPQVGDGLEKETKEERSEREASESLKARAWKTRRRTGTRSQRRATQKTHLQEGSASRTRSSYHKGHLTSLQDTVEVSEEEFFILSQTVGVRGGFLLLRLDRVAELGPFGVLELGEGVEHAVDEEGRKERNQDVSSPMDKRKARRGRRRGRVEPKGETRKGREESTNLPISSPY